MEHFTTNDLDALAVLTDCMLLTPPLAERDRSNIEKRFGPTSHDAPHLQTQPNLIEQGGGALIETVSKGFTTYLEVGELPAPGYVLQLCNLLNEVGLEVAEAAFLEGWLKHFEGRSIGGTFVKLKQRWTALYEELGTDPMDHEIHIKLAIGF